MTENERKRRLKELEELFQNGEVYKGFSSKQDCLRWANRVSPLLDFNTEYRQLFLDGLQKIQLPISMPTMEFYHNQMIGQVEMAINDLKQRKGSSEYSDLKRIFSARNLLICVVILIIAHQVYMGAKIKRIGIPNLFEIELQHEKD